ncbi:MAG: hypothetical protein HOQ46_20390, partial [Saccharothrix sp.]|nr:hypothetical protein [Saccharothrix sp.]
RLAIKLNPADQQRMNEFDRRDGYRGIVTNQATGIRYKIYGATCDLWFCLCDAVAFPVRDDAGSQLDRATKLQLRTIDARRVELYTDLDDLPSTDQARRRQIKAELAQLASEERDIRGAAA